jgi:hypothetical protein
MIIIHCSKRPCCSEPVAALQPGIHFQRITANNVYAIIEFQQASSELRSSPALIEQKARYVLRMVLYDQLCGIAGVGDLYAISFDGVDVLGMEGVFQAQEDKKGQELFHM